MSLLADTPSKQLRFLFFILIASLLIHRFFCGLLFSGLYAVPLFNPGADGIYWLLHFSGIPWLVQHVEWFGYLLDIIWISLTLFCAMGLGGKWLPRGFFLMSVVYFVVFNSFNINHSHKLIVLFIGVIPFMSPSNYDRFFQWVRWYLAFIYFSSGLWKLGRMHYFEVNYLSNLIDNQSGAFPNGLTDYLVNHPVLTFSLGLVAMLGQLAVLVIAFTHKYDLWVLWFLFLFHLGTYLLMNVWFFDMWLFGLFLIPRFQPRSDILSPDKVNREIGTGIRYF